MYIRLLILLFTLNMLSCSTTSTNITAEIIPISEEVQIRIRPQDSLYSLIYIPIGFKISNSSYKKIKFTDLLYSENGRTHANFNAYTVEDERIQVPYKQYISKFDNDKKYMIVPYFWIKEDTINDTFYKKYRTQIKNTSNDTLLIGTLQEFQQKHPKLVDDLLKGDSLYIYFDKGGKYGGMLKKIAVEW